MRPEDGSLTHFTGPNQTETMATAKLGLSALKSLPVCGPVTVRFLPTRQHVNLLYNCKSKLEQRISSSARFISLV